MKKLIAILAAALLLLPLVACEKIGPDEPGLAGAWETAEDTALTDVVKDVFEKGLEGLVGVDYEPVACLGTQIVAGTNYAVLARATPVTPNAKSYYVIVFLYKDLSGNVKPMNMAPIGPGVSQESIVGGWSGTDEIAVPETLKPTLEAKDAGYAPVARLYTQVVAGTNHCVLAKKDGGYALVTLYEDLKGNVEITDAEALDVWSLCNYGAD